MKIQDAVNIVNVLTSILNNDPNGEVGVTFAVVATKNIAILEKAIQPATDIINDFNKIQGTDQLLIEFNKGRNQIIEKYLDRDADGNVISDVQTAQIPKERLTEFNAEIEAYFAANQEAVEVVKIWESQLQNALTIEVKPILHKIPTSQVHKIRPDWLKAIIELVD